MTASDIRVKVEKLIDDYIEAVRLELHSRWKCWPLDLAKKEVHEVIGGLLARQVSLSTNLAQSPGIWNGHVAPIVLRSMTDAYISLSWIFKDPDVRSAQFIAFGLGQEKLLLEHRKQQLEADGQNVEEDLGIKAMTEWINSQQFADLTEVNVGSWSGIETRKMAQEADCLSLFNHAYAPFSSVTHNMWNHIARYNLETCPNPLHRYHMIPQDTLLSPDIDYVYRAAKYVEKSFRLFDDKTGVKQDMPSAFEGLKIGLKTLSESLPDERFPEEEEAK